MSSHLDKPIIIGTHTGAPTAADGAFYLGYGWLDTNDNLWVCTAAGTPGTWVQMTGSAPGNAAVGDVASGKTFSSANGLDLTGTAPSYFGLLQSVPTVSTALSFTLTFTPIYGADTFTVCIAQTSQKPLSSFTASEGTWTLSKSYTPTNGAYLYIYRCDGGLTTGSAVTITLTLPGSGTNTFAWALEFPPLPAFGIPTTSYNLSSATSLGINAVTPTTLLLGLFGTGNNNAIYDTDTTKWYMSTGANQAGICLQYPASTSTSLTIYSSVSVYNAAILIPA